MQDWKISPGAAAWGSTRRQMWTVTAGDRFGGRVTLDVAQRAGRGGSPALPIGASALSE